MRRWCWVMGWCWMLLASLAAPAWALTAQDDAQMGGELMQADKALQRMAAGMSPTRESISQIIDTVPTIFTEIGLAADRAFPEPGSMLHALGLALACVLVPGAVALWLRWITRHWRHRALANPMRVRSALHLLLLDVMVWVVFAVGAYLCVRFMASMRSSSTSLFVIGLVSAAVRWSASPLFLMLTLRPRQPTLRLIPMPEATARAIIFWNCLGVFVGSMVSAALPNWLRNGMPVPVGQAAALVQGVVVAFCFSMSALHFRRSFSHPPTRSQRIWWGLAVVGIPVGLFFWTMGVLHLKFDVFDSLMYTMRIGLALFVVQAVLALSEHSHWWVRLARHATNAGALLALSIVLTDLWLVQRLRLFSAASWEPVKESLVTTAITLFIGFVAWRYLDLWTEQRLRRASPGLGPGMDEHTPEPASRLTTLLPLIRVLSGLAILLLVAFLGLSLLGVNFTALVAGAGVFGLAVSFGSQALIRDIVSGIFFMTDDAFRVGEYIDTGKLKGTVERITVRSVRLRHQNGQIHTIPFGQLAAITNFSRDWLTVKFNLRMAPDTDVEKARRCVKRVGQEMEQDEEYGPEFLMPLKMQGVTDIVDNALVIRMKFTVRPGNPEMVRREVLKRLHKAFAAEDIHFASGLITVQQTEGSASVAAAAAAASATRQAAGAAIGNAAPT